MITEDYVSFETAKLLKEKGFDEPCKCLYDTENNDISIVDMWINVSNSELKERKLIYYSAPTLQMAMKWLREKKGIAVIPVLSSVLDNEKFLWDVKIVVAKHYDVYSQGWVYENQEQACEAAIKYCLENLI